MGVVVAEILIGVDNLKNADDADMRPGKIMVGWNGPRLGHWAYTKFSPRFVTAKIVARIGPRIEAIQVNGLDSKPFS